jgi:hypothetical protein
MTLPHARNLPLRRSAIIAAAVAGPLAYAAQAAAAKVLGGFAGSIEKAGPGAYVLLLGDLNSSGSSPGLRRTALSSTPDGPSFAGPVHFNAGFCGQTSDHDPLPAYFTIPAAR